MLLLLTQIQTRDNVPNLSERYIIKQRVCSSRIIKTVYQCNVPAGIMWEAQREYSKCRLLLQLEIANYVGIRRAVLNMNVSGKWVDGL